MGSIFAHDQKQYGRWKRKARVNQRGPAPLSDVALEAALMRLGEMYQGQVERRPS